MCSAPNKNTISVLRLHLGDTWGAVQVQRGFGSPTPLRVHGNLVGYPYTEVREIPIKTGEMQ